MGGGNGGVQEGYRNNAGAMWEQWFWGRSGVGFTRAV